MSRRSKTGREPAGTRRRKIRAPTRRDAAKRGHRRNSSAATLAAMVARLTRELTEAAEQQQATTEVLQLINNSFGDPDPVFASILASAVRLCEANHGAVHRWDGGALHLITTHKMPAAYVELRRRSPHRPHQLSASGRMLASRAPVHIVDLAADTAYLEGNPPTVAAVEPTTIAG